MDCSACFVYNLQPGQFPVDQETRNHQHHNQHQQGRYKNITKRTTSSPSVSHCVLQDDFYPCPAVEDWTSSSSESVISTQHPWGLGTLSQGYTLSPSFSPQNLSPSGGNGSVHPVSVYDADHLPYHDPVNVSPSMMNRPDTSPVKLEFSPLKGYHDSSSSSDWTCDVDCDVSPGFDPDAFYPSLDIPGSHSHEFPAFAHTTNTATSSTPTLSPPALTGSSCDQRSPTTATLKIEPEPEREYSHSRSNPGYNSYEGPNAESPYSKLIEQALLSTPDKKLTLQGIYDWFERNTAKRREGSKGWQNSIRHNLSMNAGFVAIRESPKGKKTVNLWRLTDEAIEKGIQSTTRYRKQANQRKGLGSEMPAPQRQRSAAKGGKATKITTKPRGHANDDELPAQSRSRSRSRSHSAAPPSVVSRQRHRQRQRQQLREHQHRHQQEQQREQQEPELSPNELYCERYVPCPTTAMPVFPEPAPAASIECFDFNLSNVNGCADPPWEPPVFSNMRGGSECLTLDMFYGLHHSTYHSPNELPNGLPLHSGWSTPEISADHPLGI